MGHFGEGVHGTREIHRQRVLQCQKDYEGSWSMVPERMRGEWVNSTRKVECGGVHRTRKVRGEGVQSTRMVECGGVHSTRKFEMRKGFKIPERLTNNGSVHKDKKKITHNPVIL
jgi:hypothetical protein